MICIHRSVKAKLVVDTSIPADGGETTASDKSVVAAAVEGDANSNIAKSATTNNSSSIFGAPSAGADSLFSFLSSSSSFNFPKPSSNGDSTETAPASDSASTFGTSGATSAFGGFSAYANSNPFAAAAATVASNGTVGIGGGFSQKSPKNPFSSVTPPPNPFMSFVDKQEEHWNLMAAKQSPSLTIASGSSSVFGFGATKSVFGSTASTTMAATTESADGTSEKPTADGGCDSKQATPVNSEDEGEDAGSDGQEDEDEAAFSGPVNTANGEESETCALQIRAKLYVLASKEIERMKPIVKETPKVGDGSPDASGAKSVATGATMEKRTEWVEIGTGPVRVLQPTATDSADGEAAASLARIVMRRESQPGGHGTKLILNEALREHTDVAKISEKALRLTVIAVGAEGKPHPVSYLFKTKLVQEADNLENVIKTLSKPSEK